MNSRLAGESAQLVFPRLLNLHSLVGRSPWTAADALVGLFDEERVQGDPRRPGGLPHYDGRIPSFGKTK